MWSRRRTSSSSNRPEPLGSSRPTAVHSSISAGSTWTSAASSSSDIAFAINPTSGTAAAPAALTPPQQSPRPSPNHPAHHHRHHHHHRQDEYGRAVHHVYP